MWSDRGKWLVVTSFCPFTLQMTRCGPWQAVVITCRICLLQLMIWTNVSEWPMLVVRMYLWKSSGCHTYECRVPLLEVVRIGEARHVYSWWNPDEVNPDDNVCHALLGDVCHMWGGVPTRMKCSWLTGTSKHFERIWVHTSNFTLLWIGDSIDIV